MAQVKTICLEALERHCVSGETGRLDFHRGQVEGHIFIKDHLLVHAQLSGLEGVPALFRLFDWGDADVIWHPGIETDLTSLHVDASEAGVMYAEHLQERSSMEARDQEKINAAFSTQSLVASYESVLKHYNIRLEAVESSLLPGGFVFSDAAKNSYVIGSNEDCDVVLRHPSVDPLHCGLILENGAIYVWDLGSQAGLKLNGAPTSEGKLKVGDVMLLGSVELRVRFNLKRPNVQRPATAPLPSVAPAPHIGPPPKEIPKGAITYEKVARQMKGSGKAAPFLSRFFGAKPDKK
jgi:pSer/pThr/pTyr-binding forkhead associated (FHA) protein